MNNSVNFSVVRNTQPRAPVSVALAQEVVSLILVSHHWIPQGFVASPSPGMLEL